MYLFWYSERNVYKDEKLLYRKKLKTNIMTLKRPINSPWYHTIVEVRDKTRYKYQRFLRQFVALEQIKNNFNCAVQKQIVKEYGKKEYIHQRYLSIFMHKIGKISMFEKRSLNLKKSLRWLWKIIIRKFSYLNEFIFQ